MAPQAILAIDQGTTTTKAILVDADGLVIQRATRALAVSYPQPAWVEQDPTALWQSVSEAITECVAGMATPVAIAITNQRESVILWERATGKPIGPCVLWQCQRGAALCRTLTAQGHEPLVRACTGLTIDPIFSASKMRWLLDQTENGGERAAQGELCLGTIDSWLLFNLTGGQIHACDMTNASRTQLFCLATQQWEPALLALFGIPLAALPEIKASSAHYGETIAGHGWPGGIPIAGMIGDAHGALYGHAGFQPGSIKATYGTGSSLMTPTPTLVLSQSGLSATIAWSHPTQIRYALEGYIYVTGAAVEWCGQLLGLANPAQEIEALAAGTLDAGEVYLVPAFVGLGAPHWQHDVHGLISGLTRGSTPTHLARATLAAIAYQICDLFYVMQAEVGSPRQVLLADGEASRNNLLMQFQADILDCPVLRSTSPDSAALGAAYLAGLASGLWPSEEAIATLPRPHDRFDPHMKPGRRVDLYAGWQAAVARAVFQPTERP